MATASTEMFIGSLRNVLTRFLSHLKLHNQVDPSKLNLDVQNHFSKRSYLEIEMSLFNKHQNQVYIESRKIIYSKKWQKYEIYLEIHSYFGIINYDISLWDRFSLEHVLLLTAPLQTYCHVTVF